MINSTEKDIDSSYGYNGKIHSLRESEFKRLRGCIYLDNAGSALYSETQIRKYSDLMLNNVFGNPHSQSESSILSQNEIEKARIMLLNYFNTNNNEYQVVFTSGSTESLKIIAEYFPWNEDSSFYYQFESHNSVIGMREYALKYGASFKAIDIEKCNSIYPHNSNAHNLLAFSAQCNFSGVKFDLNLIEKFKKQCWKVLLDAASYLSTSRLDLSKYKPDFVVLSFYKIFGFPTGVGALLVHNNVKDLLRKHYFGGGTVKVSLPGEHFSHFRDTIHEMLEDGTANFLSIASLKFGFEWINQLGMDNIAKHTYALTKYTYEIMSSMKYKNGQPCFEIYGNHSENNILKQGPIISFNIFWENGTYVGYNDVQRLSSLHNIHIRTGCFCNPGACQKYLYLTNEEIKQNFESGHICWDSKDIINNKPTGCIRISFHNMSTKEDVDYFISFLKKFFIDINEYTENNSNIVKEGIIKNIYIYPVKSCAGFEVTEWEIKEEGFMYDREWAIVDSYGDYINQKSFPRMCLIQPSIDLQKNLLILNAPMMEPLEIDLSYYPTDATEIMVCGDSCRGIKYNSEVNSWLKKFLESDVFLVRKVPDEFRKAKVRTKKESSHDSVIKSMNDLSAKIRFVNESQFLIINNQSIKDLISRLNENGYKFDYDITKNFRPNIIVDCEYSYDEDNWDIIDIDGQILRSTGPCNRCKMICLDNKRATFTSEPLSTLSQYRRKDGKILFGQLFSHVPSISQQPYSIKVNSKFKILSRCKY